MTDLEAYRAFIARKLATAPVEGIPNHGPISPLLFPHQRTMVDVALRKGRFALFHDTGLGKGWQILEWARLVGEHTGKPVLVLAPLAVARQFEREAAKLGTAVRIVSSAADVGPGINVTNYHKLHKFDVSVFSGVALDESSILKSFDGTTRTALIEAFANTPYRLCATATPSPNDHTELGNHGMFLGVMSYAEMLSMFFVHDGSSSASTGGWRLKGHARDVFWRWVATWAASLRRPSDLGFADDGYDLPPMTFHEHVIPGDLKQAHASGALFVTAASTLAEQRAARRGTLDARVAKCAEIVAAEPDQDFLIWVDLNDEGDAIEAAVPGAVQVSGSDDDDFKVSAAEWFSGGCACPCGKTTGTSDITRMRTGDASASQNPSRDGSRFQSTRDANISESTCVSTPSDQTSSPNARPSDLNDSPSDASSTRPTHRSGSGTDDTPKNGRQKTRTSVRSGGSAPTDSLNHNGTPCSPSRAGVAQSAEGLTGQSVPDYPGTAVDGCISTTATRPESCVDSFAGHAILGSGTSLTTSASSERRFCTCGRPLGGRKVLVSKSAIFGFGLNFQTCSRVVFCGVSHSFEGWYQAIRRVWRFGQRNPVNVHMVTSELEGRVVENLKRKQRDAEDMAQSMVAAMADFCRAEIGATQRQTIDYSPTVPMRVPAWLRTEGT